MNYNSSITDSLATHLTDNSPIIVFGAGNLGRKIAAFLINEKKNVVAFSDNNSRIWNNDLLGLKVLPPSEIPLEAIIIVAIWSPENSYKQAKEQLLKSGAVNIYHASALMKLYPQKLLPYYHFETSDYFLKYQDLQNEVINILADDESKKQYQAHLNCRINLNFEDLPDADTKNQYFPSDIVTLTENEVFLDSGAFIGDTFADFGQRTNWKFSKYIALEPDPKNFDKLINVIPSEIKNKVKVFPYAVGAENTILKFDATGGGGAGISEMGNIEVECVRIDDHFLNEKPTFLKFDIEGAELDALKGANKTILTHKPKLAVCIYHLPDDLWQIPLYINKHYPFYKLYVRTHQFDGLDFVLYAIN
jgi:FkbM family methyltransferase